MGNGTMKAYEVDGDTLMSELPEDATIIYIKDVGQLMGKFLGRWEPLVLDENGFSIQTAIPGRVSIK